MMQDNPFADLIPAKPQQPQAPPAYIPGRPVTPTPLELSREARAARGEDRANAAAERAAVASERAAANSARALENDAQRLNRENVDAQSSLRKEFQALPNVKTFNEVRTSRQGIRALALKPDATAQDDIAIIFQYMKMLDPGSVVREGEFATAQNAAGIPTAIQNAYNKALNGERLSREQRLQMAQTAERLYQTQREGYNNEATRYREMAQLQGINPDLIARRYIPDGQRPEASPVGQRMAPVTATTVAELMTGLRGGQYTLGEDGSILADGKPIEASDEVLNSNEYRQAYQDKFGVPAPLSVSVTGGSGPDGSPPPPTRGQNPNLENVDAFVRGAADTASLGLATPIAAAADTIFGGGTMRDNLAAQQGVDAYDRRNNYVARGLGQAAGGLVLPTFGASTPGQLAALGAGYGGTYAGISSDGPIADRLVAAGIGATTGAVTGYAGGALSQRLARQNTPKPLDEVSQAAIDQGVDVVRPDINPKARSFYGFAESMPFAGARIRGDLQRGADQMANRVEQIGGGAATPRNTAGAAIRSGAERYIERSRGVVNRAYDAAERAAGNAQVSPTAAVQNIDNQLAQLSVTKGANATKISILQKLRGDMVDDAGNVRALPIAAIRDLRTSMRDELNAAGLRYSDTERRVMQVIDEASTDIASQLSGSALRKYQRADRLYRDRAQMVDDVVKRFIGRKDAPTSDEQVMGVVDRMSAPRSGDERRLSAMIERLDPSERQQVQSAITGTLGRGGDSAADFSPGRFFTEIKKYSPQAREAIFGKQGAKDLQQLATIAEARAGTMSQLNNSRSGQVGNWRAALGALFSGGGAGGVVGAATGIGAGAGGAAGMVAAPAALGAVYLRARSLGNPRFLTAMANASRATTPSQQRQVVSQLSALAAREPTLTAEIIPIRDFLSRAISQSPSRASATGQNE